MITYNVKSQNVSRNKIMNSLLCKWCFYGYLKPKYLAIIIMKD